jgi:phosphoribosylanthranilate isomerase
MAVKIKVCGMKYPENIRAIAADGPDYLGFIFYEKSKRFTGEDLEEEVLKNLDPAICKVGVFVNHSNEYIERKAREYGLGLLQLHGNESPAQCAELKSKGHKIVKVFQVDDAFDFSVTEPFKEHADYFLFDTKSDGYGGTGRKFDWAIFEKYDNEVPIFLSGGLDFESIDEIKKLDYLNIHAVDINSKFETAPGRKNEGNVKLFMDRLRDEIRS